MQILTTVGSSIEIVSEEYFLGGTQRKVMINGEQRLSIIPQPAANGTHNNLFEIAVLTYGGQNLEVVGAYLTESEVAKTIGEMILNGSL